MSSDCAPIILDRDFVRGLFKTLGCTTVDHWDDDVLVSRLQRVPAMMTEERWQLIEFRPYVDTVKRLRDSRPLCRIIIKSNDEPKAQPVPVIDKPIRVGPRRKNTGKATKRRERFSFQKCGIPRGATLVLKRNPQITCTVIDDPWHVDFGDGEWTSFTARTKALIGAKETTYLSPMHYWMYNGRLLRDYYEEWQGKKNKARRNGEDYGT